MISTEQKKESLGPMKENNKTRIVRAQYSVQPVRIKARGSRESNFTMMEKSPICPGVGRIKYSDPKLLNVDYLLILMKAGWTFSYSFGYHLRSLFVIVYSYSTLNDLYKE